MADQQETIPVWAKCSSCGHCWPVAYLPVELGKLAQITGPAACPKCGARKLAVANQSDGVLQEMQAA